MRIDSRQRRKLLKCAAGVGLAAPTLGAVAGATEAAMAPLGQAAGARGADLADELIRVEYDASMRSRVTRLGSGLRTDWCVSESVDLLPAGRAEHFALRARTLEDVDDARHGAGRVLRLVGVSAEGLEKTLELRLYGRHPGFAFVRVAYRNVTARPLELQAWSQGAYAIAARTRPVPDTWSFNGGTYPDRRDWLQPVKEGFAQDNFLGMTGSDYGGGTPLVDLWRRDGGIAVGHLEAVPLQVGVPARGGAGRAALAVRAQERVTLAPGGAMATPETFVAVHRGDYFAALDRYRRVMAERGLQSPPPPAVSYAPVWCAWGYERECTPELVAATLPKVRELGLDWAVLDDGWQRVIGDWTLDPRKYPRGDEDMKRLVAQMRAHGLKPRLWYSPLSVAPGADLLHEHPDLLLLDADGAVQKISWWNTFTLCPAYAPTVAQAVALVRKFIGDWGFAGLKLDGQHMNAVAPCFNPAHRHDRPAQSAERLPDFYRAIYEAARQIDPQAVIEYCPCGTVYSFHNLVHANHAPASDPESAWQVRHKGKTLKALMGPGAPYAGDHVELTPGNDFASTVGIGAIVSTKFTWPQDPKPKDSFLLTAEREAQWRHWIGLYRERMLPQGIYRGELYDIAFDKPEGHAVQCADRHYFAFFAPHWQGPVELRGLEPRAYRLRDYARGHELGTVRGGQARLAVEFDDYLLLEALPA